MKIVYPALLLAVLSVFLFTTNALADEPICVFNPDGSITCTASTPPEDNGSGEQSPTPAPGSCSPGEVRATRITRYVPESGGSCTSYEEVVDSCSGTILAPGDIEYGVPCPQAQSSAPQHPCDTLVVTAGGISCDARDGWHIAVTLPFPTMYLDVRPFPATLVRWPTAIRNGGTPEASASGGQAYYGSSSPGSLNEGDLSDIRLTLILRPATPMLVSLPQVGSFSLPDRGANGVPSVFRWEVPSHPAAGGGVLAGSVPGLNELPSDMPLFSGSGRTAYRLFWRLEYDVYEPRKECQTGPDINGRYDCDNDRGHTIITGYDWQGHSNGGEIPVTAIAGLPSGLAADLNHDGDLDAIWNTQLTLRRMDESGSVNNPAYRRSWNWGGVIYWAVREGQGQIGWPGVP